MATVTSDGTVPAREGQSGAGEPLARAESGGQTVSIVRQVTEDERDRVLGREGQVGRDPDREGKRPRVGIVMGSDSDLEIMRPASETLAELGLTHELRVVSAHRTPDDMLAYGHQARERGLQVIIAGAGGAAHLPGMLAATTILPVIGVPVPLRDLNGLDSLLSIVQMPAGVPVATVAIGAARNAALLAARIIAVGDPALGEALEALATEMAEASRAKDGRLVASTSGEIAGEVGSGLETE